MARWRAVGKRLVMLWGVVGTGRHHSAKSKSAGPPQCRRSECFVVCRRLCSEACLSPRKWRRLSEPQSARLPRFPVTAITQHPHPFLPTAPTTTSPVTAITIKTHCACCCLPACLPPKSHDRS
ncbi:hypothetical protein IWX47DRAFT_265395 [Phyllosticta citricarpa]